MLRGQQQYRSRTLFWLIPEVKIALPNDFRLHVEAEYRAFVFPSRTHQVIIPAFELHKNLSENWDVAVGGMHFLSYQPNDPFEDVDQVITEWRSFFELSYRESLNDKQQIVQRAKIEERFFMLETGTLFLIRSRYRIQWKKQLQWKERKTTWFIDAEPMWQFGAELPLGHFDQVRFRTGLRAPVGRLELELAYMYWFQQSGRAGVYFSHHILPLRIMLNL